MDNNQYLPESPRIDESKRLPAPERPEESPGSPGKGQPPGSEELSPGQRRTAIIAFILIVIVLALVIASIVGLARLPGDTVAQIRDIFIIFMALMSMLTALALVILMIQLARLTNLLQNEIKPILDSLNQTISHLRGTSVFLSENVSEPIIKLNEYMSGLNQLLYSLGLIRKKQ